jgi:hypothetical protein
MNLGPPQSSIKLHKQNTIEPLNNVTITVINLMILYKQRTAVSITLVSKIDLIFLKLRKTNIGEL